MNIEISNMKCYPIVHKKLYSTFFGGLGIEIATDLGFKSRLVIIMSTCILPQSTYLFEIFTYSKNMHM